LGETLEFDPVLGTFRHLVEPQPVLLETDKQSETPAGRVEIEEEGLEIGLMDLLNVAVLEGELIEDEVDFLPVQ